MTEFSDRPLVVGSITGLRSFDVDSLGRLTGVRYPGVFRPGENVAQCRASSLSPLALSLLATGTAWTFSRTTASANDKPETEVAKQEHRAAGLSCSCGFYAYFDDGDNPHHKPGNVLGVVEGYGSVTVGSRGFRAEKARLVALVEERRPWLLSDAIRAAMFAVLCGVQAAGLFLNPYISFSRYGGNGAVASVLGILYALQLVAAVLTGIAVRRVHRRIPAGSRIPDTVRRNYPDVPVYPSLKAAIAAHPLTPPPAPTPETDDDFWTRSAS